MIFTVSGLLFFQNLLATLLFGQISLIDEILIAILLPYLFFHSEQDPHIRRFKNVIFLSIPILFLSSFNSFGQIPYWKIFLQTIIHLKFFILLLFFLSIKNVSRIDTIVSLAIAGTIIGLLANILFGADFNELFGFKATFRFGEIRPVGFQGDTASMGLLFSFYYLNRIFKKREVSTQVFIIYSVIMLLLTSLLTLRSPIIVIFIAFIAAMIVNPRLIIASTLLFIATTSILLSLGLDETLMRYYSITLQNIDWINNPVESAYIRGIMLFFSVVLSIDFFPFGAGAGSFGTVLSLGSWVYDYIGLANSTFFINADGIYDSNFASILGEFGIVGIVVFATIFTSLYRVLLKKFKMNKIALISFIFSLLAFSVVTPLFMNSFPAFFVAMIIACSARCYSEQKI